VRYRARDVYRTEEVVGAYDQRRFSSVKGKLTDKLEKRLIDKALEAASISSGARILDIPCGTGRLSIYLAHRGLEITGADISLLMVEKAKEKAKKINLAHKIQFEIAEAERLPHGDSAFDAIVSLRLLGHTPPEARVALLKEFARVSKNYLVLTFYSRNCLQGFLRKRRRRKAGGEWYPVSSRQMDKELEAAGLEKAKVFPLFAGVSETVVVLARKSLE